MKGRMDEKMTDPLVKAEYLLHKFPGKGGWTYAAIPEVLQNKNTPFGWVKVRGSIDDFKLEHVKLMPMGNGKLFLPVKAQIRRLIKKEAGDMVKVILYSDETPLIIPEEIMSCFQNERQKIFDTFSSYSEGEQKAYMDWIYSAKLEETKVERIATMLKKLDLGKRLRDQ